MIPRTWKVSLHQEFAPEFSAFSQSIQDELLATADAVKRLGPSADRPHVGTLKNSKHPNMKELRFKINNGAEIWRAAFAFDPNQNAIILVAADKQGVDEDQFYKKLLKIANARFDTHLKALKAAAAQEEKAAKAATKSGKKRK